MRGKYYYIINSITIYRLVMGFVLAGLVAANQPGIFKWLLPVSFLTDAIDGLLARKYKVESQAGALRDSIADDITVAAAIVAALRFKWAFMKEHDVIFLVLAALYVLQVTLALIRYRKLSGFHTILAKIAAVLQGCFFVLLFLLPNALSGIFYATAIITGAGLCEEIILVLLLPKWQTNVKGLYWVLKRRK